MTRHTEDQLRGMVRHLHYEHERLWTPFMVAFPALRPTGDLQLDEVFATLTGQARLEAALVHLRVMITFLTSRADDRYPVGLVADDYFDGGWPGKPNVVIGKNPQQQRDILKELDQRLAHLSLRRLDAETSAGGFAWSDVIKHARTVFVSFDRFRDDLSRVHPKRSAWFDAYPFPRATDFT